VALHHANPATIAMNPVILLTCEAVMTVTVVMLLVIRIAGPHHLRRMLWVDTRILDADAGRLFGSSFLRDPSGSRALCHSHHNPPTSFVLSYVISRSPPRRR
jgi:hypothetical protein